MTEVMYSPVLNMDISSIEESSLKSLKYHELLKFANRHKVMKRWAKKDELIRALLTLKQETARKNEECREIEWRDAKDVIFASPICDKENDPARATFTLPSKTLDDPRATYNLSKATLPGLNLSEVDSRLTFDVPKGLALKTKTVCPTEKQVKKLTVPMSYRSSPKHSSKITLAKESPLKLSNRSIAIKKPKDAIIVRSPLRGKRSVIDKQAKIYALSSSQTTSVAKKPAAPSRPSNVSFESVQRRRKSKSDDPNAGRPNVSKPTYRSPQPPSKTGKRSTAKKVPDFAMIHQRQFERMDSLDQYIAKKNDRVKKLFGTPTNYLPEKTKVNENKTVNEEKRAAPRSTPVKAQVETAKKLMNKNPQLRTTTDVKDKNRSHIHGIRTNKRFELQMKFRNL